MFIAFADQKAASDSGRRVAPRGGFTLLEITLAVAILATMSLAIYRFVQSNLTALRTSADANAADACYSGLRDLLAAQWQSLPSGQGGLTGAPFKLNDRQRAQIQWICGSGSGLLTRYAPGQFTVSLRLQPEKKKSNQHDLGLLRTRQDDSVHETWVHLVKNMNSRQIKYF